MGVARASGSARCRGRAETSKYRASVLSLQSGTSSGSMELLGQRTHSVASTVNPGQVSPLCPQAARRKLRSNDALCATNTHPCVNFSRPGSTVATRRRREHPVTDPGQVLDARRYRRAWVDERSELPAPGRAPHQDGSYLRDRCLLRRPPRRIQIHHGELQLGQRRHAVPAWSRPHHTRACRTHHRRSGHRHFRQGPTRSRSRPHLSWWHTCAPRNVSARPYRVLVPSHRANRAGTPLPGLRSEGRSE